MMIHNLVNPDTGRTYKEDNLLLEHNIPDGALVEVDSNGVRLHVVHRGRDCDGTPLYWLGITGKSYMVDGQGYRTFGGYSESSLRVIDARQ